MCAWDNTMEIKKKYYIKIINIENKILKEIGMGYLKELWSNKRDIPMETKTDNIQGEFFVDVGQRSR